MIIRLLTVLLSVNGAMCFSDCYDIKQQNPDATSGVYNVTLWWSKVSIEVYCDMDTAGGGWTVFQNRFNGSVDFFNDLDAYTNMFGNINSEFWLGLKFIKELADQGEMTLRFDVSAADGTTGYEEWKGFRLAGPPGYQLFVGGNGTGSALNQSEIFKNDRYFEQSNNGSSFAARESVCGDLDWGGWWFAFCTHINLNGRYLKPGTISGVGPDCGIIYLSFKGAESLKTTRMMLRRENGNHT
ncbi:microfibril-associated glycoprotein 4-like [Mya arenaria]|uniref:microfibril-associated glycoprotein 4-like n=1 Tax=Mya arenaria TaxID=6604 RepID=UPI0022E1AEA5|nr:microfibril-associated glycoprotein 4-like [Mya arenaria]